MIDPASMTNNRRRLKWRQVAILYRRELRAALREKSIVVNSLLIPLFLYPFILWAAFTGMMFVQGQTEGLVSRVAVLGWPAGHPRLHTEFVSDHKIALVTQHVAAADLETEIKNGELDALVQFSPAAHPGAGLSANFQVRLLYNASQERSKTARNRVKALLDHYRETWMRRVAARHGIPAARWEGFSLESHNLASGKAMGAFILGLMLPVMFVVMVAVGCFYPAVDATAGERERHTWETLMATAASRQNIVTAKYLYVASLGGLAGLLNCTAVLATIGPILAPLLGRSGATFHYSVPWLACPLLVLAALLLGGFVAAGMMIFASFARTFKEGQAMITPFYLIILLPVVFLAMPGIRFSLGLACIPIVNLTLMLREAIAGTYHWPQIGITLVVSAGLIAACLRLAVWILQFEDLVMGSYGGSFYRFVRERLGRRRRPLSPVTEVRP